MKSAMGRTFIMAVIVLAAQVTSSFGESTTNLAPTISRKILVTAKQTKAMHGMIAKGNVTISGTARTDSFDSSDPGKSEFGRYQAGKAGQDGFVGTTSQIPGDLRITGTADIIGAVGTGAPGVYTVSGSAAAGSKDWIDTGVRGVETGYLQTDLNASFPDVVPPFTPTSFTPTPKPGIVDGTNYDYVLNGGEFSMSDFSLVLSQKAIVKGHVVFYVTGNFSMSGDAQFIVAEGATLDLYVGKTTTITGGGMVNLSGKAENLNYYGLPGNTLVKLTGSANLIAIIYAPSALLDFDGTSSFSGASVSQSMKLGGSFDFHYDESLNHRGMRYVPTRWKEL